MIPQAPANPIPIVRQTTFSKTIGPVTPDTWYDALLELQATPTARAAMREVAQWLKENPKTARRDEEATKKQSEKLTKVEKKVREKAPYQAREKQVRPSRVETCSWCKTDFLTRRVDHKFCSRACQVANKSANERKGIPDASCATCGVVFSRIRANQKYCTACLKDATLEQRRRSKRLLYQQKEKTMHAKTCAVCGVAFESVRSTARACSPECIETYDKHPKFYHRAKKAEATNG